MYKAKIDLAVLIIFFSRPQTLKETFQRVKDARPSKLFLFCDGSRGNAEEDLRIAESKQIVEDIDWECDVHRHYMDINLGCGKGPTEAISWAFTYVDKLLILEDDCVANPTLFPYMKEMLDYYESDERIGLISGFNHFKEWNTNEYSYCFTKTGPTLGWGTWKRVWNYFDFNVSNAKDTYLCGLLEKEIYNEKVGKKRCYEWQKASIETYQRKVSYWDIQFGFVKYTQSLLSIVPSGNLICNIGVGVGSTHTEKNTITEWKPGQVFFMPTVDMEFPLKHPPYVVCDRNYDEKYFKQGYPCKVIKCIRKIKRKIFR